MFIHNCIDMHIKCEDIVHIGQTGVYVTYIVPLHVLKIFTWLSDTCVHK